MLSFARAQALAKTTPARIRQDLFGAPTSAPLLVVDDYWALRTVDAEVGTLLLLPASAASNDDRLVWQADLSIGASFGRRGQVSVASTPPWRGASFRADSTPQRRTLVGIATFRRQIMTTKEKKSMTANLKSLVISDDNLSRAWSRAFLHIIDNPAKRSRHCL
ncbi:MAG: hypothetical protein U0531_09610 [Dehalococcoidia bacterium]